ncbi:MAG: four helix bundle protein [Bacteroidota bacterium]
MVSQMNRAAISIPYNISEGCGRGTDAQLVHFLDIAIGSNCELETQFYLAYDINYISSELLEKLTDEIAQIRRMTIKFSAKYRK